MRSAMVRAAKRRGSSIIIFCPVSQVSSSKASGNKVLLPAPGGACTISVFRAARCSLTLGIISRTGKSMVKGLKGKINDFYTVVDFVNRRSLTVQISLILLANVVVLPLTHSKEGLFSKTLKLSFRGKWKNGSIRKYTSK